MVFHFLKKNYKFIKEVINSPKNKAKYIVESKRYHVEKLRKNEKLKKSHISFLGDKSDDVRTEVFILLSNEIKIKKQSKFIAACKNIKKKKKYKERKIKVNFKSGDRIWLKVFCRKTRKLLDKEERTVLYSKKGKVFLESKYERDEIDPFSPNFTQDGKEVDMDKKPLITCSDRHVISKIK